MKSDSTPRLAAVGDIHCGKDDRGTLRQLFAAASEKADVLLLLGDLTRYGTIEEGEILVEELSVASRIPRVAVLGNHDFESDHADELRAMFDAAGIRILDGTSWVVDGVGFAGVKGFGGGFGRRALAPWGEKVIKEFVREAVDEAVKLESALAALRTEYKVVLLHYAPIHETIKGEPEQIAPFLGSSRLEEAIDRYRATVAFHGHAHYGSLEGRTKGDVPVYNVAMPLLSRERPGEPPFLLYELRSSEVAVT